MARHMYEVSAEVEPQPGVEFPPECIGAFVHCYVPADSLAASLDVARTYLEASGLRVIDLDHALRLDLDEYQPYDEDHPSREAVVQAYFAGASLNGPFLTYEAP